jgi:uncharacterized protein (DUF433 family)
VADAAIRIRPRSPFTARLRRQARFELERLFMSVSKVIEEPLHAAPIERGIPPITTNPERMGGTPVIGIYRLPIATLLDYLIGGQTVDEFLDDFPGTDKETVIAALECIKEALDDGLLAEKVDY